MSITIHEVPGKGPYALTTGPDGALWSALEAGALARLTPPQP